MHLSNLSQVLSRNEDLLIANDALLVNMPADELDVLFKQLNPNGRLSYFDNNFELHQSHQHRSAHHCVFDASYQTDITHDLVIIAFPKSKSELLFTLAMLAPCVSEHSKILILGDNKSGIKSLKNVIKNHCHYCEKIDSARHCTLFEIALQPQQQAFNLNDWYHYYPVTIGEQTFKVAALPGVFSQKGLDKGTKVLLAHLPNTFNGKILDFGCGAGVIACFIGLGNADTELALADVSALALASSRKTLEINGLNGVFIATNSLSNIKDSYHFVISNPPFHQGIKTHYLATEQFLANIKNHLLSKGTLTIVANSFLKYTPIIEQAFGNVSRLTVEQGFAIYQAKRN